MILKEVVGCNVKTKHIYLTYAGKYIGAYNPYTNEVVGYDTLDNFEPFVKKILKNFPDYSPHNVINEGISEEIQKKIIKDYRCKEQAKQR